MKNYPKYLATKEDYEYVKKYFPKEKWKPSYQALLDDSQKLFREKELAKQEDGITDKFSLVRAEREEKDGETTIKYYQHKYMLDPNCKLLRLGMKIKDVQNALKE